jgi:hypothetical protein
LIDIASEHNTCLIFKTTWMHPSEIHLFIPRILLQIHITAWHDYGGEIWISWYKGLKLVLTKLCLLIQCSLAADFPQLSVLFFNLGANTWSDI